MGTLYMYVSVLSEINYYYYYYMFQTMLDTEVQKT